jgi:hypothetical protein
MTRVSRIHDLLEKTAIEICEFIKENEKSYIDRWVPAKTIKSDLNLTLSAYPQGNKIDNKTGWLFATFARMLQDMNMVEFRNDGRFSYYRTKINQ